MIYFIGTYNNYKMPFKHLIFSYIFLFKNYINIYTFQNVG